jgi:2-polyprenyl-3-methyl-5-hydroxy-6-metoxy-1,4-benzoquinol methylase
MSLAMKDSLGKSDSHLYARALEIAGLTEKKKRILDLGCGEGTLLLNLKSQGFLDLLGCDGFQHGFPADIAFHKQDLNQQWELPDQYDIIFSLEVIEHLENPRFFFRQLYRSLKKGGEILISTPNNESFTSLLSLFLKGNYSAFVGKCYPAHITPVLSMDAMRMAQEVRFHDIQIAWSDRGRIPGISQHWQSLFGSWLGGKRFSDNYFLRAVK